MKTPANVAILVGRRDQGVRRLGEGLRPEAAAILEHQLEAAGGAQALDGRRVGSR